MKRINIIIMLVILMSMIGNKSYGYDIAVNNDDGVTIYYNYINNNSELSVTYSYRNYSYDNYYGYENIASISIPKTVTYEGNIYSVTAIGNHAFYYCSSLTSVTIPSSVTSIGDYAFYGCSGLTTVTIPNSVTSIGSYAFSRTYIKSLTIGTGVLKIGNEALGSSKPAKTIWLTNTPPAGYTYAAGSINYVANDLYTSLSNQKVYPFLSSIFEVDGVKYVPVSPSERTCDVIDCKYDESIANVHINSTVSYMGVNMTVKDVNPYSFYKNNYIKEVKVNNDGVIGDYAFYDCESITTVNISNKGNIGTWSFSDCDGIISIDLSNDGDIGKYAFYSCEALRIAKVCNNGLIGDYAFEGCSSLETCTLGEEVTRINDSAFNDCSKLQKIVIPDLVDLIGSYAFSGCSSLLSATIGNGTKSIGSYAFSGCSSLLSATIGNGTKSIGSYAFSGCSSLPLIVIPPSVSSIKNNSFSRCSNLSTVIIADRINELNLGSNGSSPLFSSCPLDSVYIGGNITYKTSSSYGYSPFYRNISLRTIHITDKETEISENEFYGCSNLKNVRIGDGVTTIGNWAFSGCSSLDYFAFGEKVETIGQEAFSDCVNMTKIISRAETPPTCNSQALDDINKWNCELKVPIGSLTAYQNADQWKEFFFISEANINVTDISLTPTAYTLVGIGSQIQLTVTVLPENATDKSVVWTSSNESICKVVNGNVVAVGAGSATITATTVDGGFTAQCVVTVTIPVTGVSLNYSTYTLKGIGESVQLVATVLPNNAVNKDVVWTSSNESVCKVVNGNVVAVGAGSATITATTVDGGFKAQCTIIVENNNPATKEGDANDDGFVDVTDIALIVNYILGRDMSNFNFAAADVNADGFIDVADFAGVANIILYGSHQNMMTHLKHSEQESYDNNCVIVDTPDVEMQKGEITMIPFNMINEEDGVSSFQMDIHLPKGMTLLDVNMVENRKTSHTVDWVMVSQNVARVLYFSHNNSRIKGVNGPIIYLSAIVDDTVVEGSYAMSVEKIILTGDGDRITADNVSSTLLVSDPNGIVGAQFDNNAYHDYYSVDGYRMNKLRKGINIVRDRNGKTKKIVKLK